MSCAGGCAQYPAFSLGSSKAAAGFLGLFVLFVQNLPQLCMHVVIFDPCSFLVFCYSRRDPGASVTALEQKVPGPRLFHTHTPQSVRTWTHLVFNDYLYM